MIFSLSEKWFDAEPEIGLSIRENPSGTISIVARDKTSGDYRVIITFQQGGRMVVWSTSAERMGIKIINGRKKNHD